jgi:hypothetical protein
MARLRFNPKGIAPSPQHLAAEFMAALLGGDVRAERLIETRDARGQVVRLDYDEPAARPAGTPR